MSISKTTSDYTGRKKDISIFQSPDATLTGPQDVTPAFGVRAKFCAGIQKLIQAYAIILLSDIASQKNYPDFGTNFMPSLKAGISPVDQLAAAQIFAYASYNAVLALRSYQAEHPEIPADERISRVELDSISLYGSYVAFNIRLYPEAGDVVEFVVPLPK